VPKTAWVLLVSHSLVAAAIQRKSKRQQATLQQPPEQHPYKGSSSVYGVFVSHKLSMMTHILIFKNSTKNLIHSTKQKSNHICFNQGGSRKTHFIFSRAFSRKTFSSFSLVVEKGRRD
jgi:hypothetical protein